ncbi:MAG: hypothetical protein ABH824_04935 [Nanoarchaeota archaeon]
MYKKRNRIDVFRFISNKFTRNTHERKGQVTVFIILGILLLLALILVILLKQEIVIFKPEEIIPTDKGKVENFINTCIGEVGEEALFKIGLQGGYIEVPSDIANDGSLHLRNSPFTVVPFWAYGLTTNIPSLQLIKEDIDNYLEENVRNCLLGKEAFQEAYDLIEKSPIEANTEIVESKVIFNLHWNIEIRDKNGEVITEVINHVEESPIKLKSVHETAQKIIEREMETLKLEDITQDLIALEHPNVPVAGMEMSCGQKSWKIETVKETLKDMLRINIRELKVRGTDYVEFPEELPYYQNHYIFDLGDDFVKPQVSVLFGYENNYPFSFDVTPRSGAYMKSNPLIGGNELLSFLCMQTWKFVYDVDYPVLVTITDETTGYDFKVAFTVHLKRNIPDRRVDVNKRESFFIDTVSDEEFCQEAKVPMMVYTYKLVEEENAGINDREPLENVNLIFTCLKYLCEKGKTEYDFAGMGNVAAYKTNFPYCVGGIMRGKKEGYKDGWQRVVTSPEKEVELDMTPLFYFPANKIKVMKHELTDEGVNNGIMLSKDDIAFIKITYMKNNETFHEINSVSTGKYDPKILLDEKLGFLAEADFTYNLEINVLNEDKFIGGYKGNWTVSWDELQEADEMVFHVVSKDKASEDEMFELILGLGKNSALIPEPEFK